MAKLIYIVILKVSENETYYLSSLTFSVSKSIRDAVVFTKKDDALFNASLLEKYFPNHLGSIEEFEFEKLL